MSKKYTAAQYANAALELAILYEADAKLGLALLDMGWFRWSKGEQKYWEDVALNAENALGLNQRAVSVLNIYLHSGRRPLNLVHVDEASA